MDRGFQGVRVVWLRRLDALGSFSLSGRKLREKSLRGVSASVRSLLRLRLPVPLEKSLPSFYVMGLSI